MRLCDKLEKRETLRKRWHAKKRSWSILLRGNDIICIIRASSKNMILKWESYSVSCFETKLYNESDVELNFWNQSEFEKGLFSKNDVIKHVTPRNRHFLRFPCSSETQYFRLKTLQCLRLGIQKWSRKQNFCPKTLQCVRIWFETFTTCQVLNLKNLKRVNITKKFALKKIFHEVCYSVKRTFFCFFRASSEIVFENWILQ